ncbi:MAG: hypothetical protein HY661_21225 [Betaproteobacteria bacterium]|nr:hypothetical protein [Betaproteobacteria bacterium]
MSHFTEACGEAVTQKHSLPYSGPGEAATQGIAVAAMILDRWGTVRYCDADAACLFHATPNTLVGRHVRELIPELPFDRRTPGYNVAYAAFWTPTGPSRSFSGVDSRGRLFGVWLALDRLELEKHQQILLRLRPHVESTHLPAPCIDGGEVAGVRADPAPRQPFAG